MNNEALMWTIWAGMWLVFWLATDEMDTVRNIMLGVLVMGMCIFYKHWTM
jgi:hypothetical protein